ncbi:MAG: hypothetical protein QOG61_1932 [Candidatus Binataceae bacterium]|jgi:hypothetical protein|nr:hypothetical protein [Candidatus Binataceae bacterium]
MKIKIETEKKPGTGAEITWLTASAKAANQAALDAVNGKAEAFTVCCANRVYELSLRAEDYLQDNVVPESDRAGATVTFRPAGPQAAAYKNAAISTTVTLANRQRLVPDRRQAHAHLPARSPALPRHDHGSRRRQPHPAHAQGVRP